MDLGCRRRPWNMHVDGIVMMKNHMISMRQTRWSRGSACARSHPRWREADAAHLFLKKKQEKKKTAQAFPFQACAQAPTCAIGAPSATNEPHADDPMVTTWIALSE